MPATVIVKRFRQDDGSAYDPDDATSRARRRLLGEWTGVRFLHGLGGERSFGPAPYAGDGRLGLVVLEDLGDGTCLADLLTGDDPIGAEAALAAYASTLGRLHAATVGRGAGYGALMETLAADGAEHPGTDTTLSLWKDAPTRFHEALAQLDLPLPAAADSELERLGAMLSDAGPFSAYSPGDTCPDNHRYIPGEGDDLGYVRFFDMEFGGFRHALLEAAYLWMPFPTCWCCNRLPNDLIPRLGAVYRAELVKGCPEAGDDGVFQRALVEACGVWWVITISWSFASALERDTSWGLSTLHARFPLWAENFARVSECYGHVPALGDLAHEAAARMRERWAESSMPLYPAFRQPRPAGGGQMEQTQ